MSTSSKPLRWPSRLKTAQLFLLATTVALLESVASGQALLNSARVSQEPGLVGAQSADLTLMFVSPEVIPAGSTISVTVPPQASFEVSDSVPCQLQGV